ncbi:helicase C-terminal domain-containing protein [Miniimonas arenae]|uniref:helicase C-terminal domain-containing protein n=1 Tax=Miniimonas arenae TaxID=676201 RepID=UPI0028AB2006|nr:helicase C-terminal domain-containing protein [Miniimonas arenae]
MTRLQLVFCDRSTPKYDGTFAVYEALADDLTARGIPREKIAFIHDARDDLARADLFHRARTGEIAVLIGSTEKMGTGTNVQDRAVALHHMDCPWRPADLEQREGRILRQGNQNRQVEVINYVTEGTYDAVMWQIVARKAAFIAQTKNTGASRTLADVEDDMTISAAAASAIATGDPRIIARAELVETVGNLTALRDAHHSLTGQARTRAALAAGSAQRDSATLAQVTALQARHRPNTGATTPTGTPLTDRVGAGTHIATTAMANAARLREGEIVPVLTYEGIPFEIHTSRVPRVDGSVRTTHHLTATGCPDITTRLDEHPTM